MTLQQHPLIYLNNAATSWPKPPQIMEAVAKSLALPVFGSGRTTGTQGEDHVTQAREELALLLRADHPDHIVFTHNATYALNLLISGFIAGGERGCHVLTTALDHNSVLRPLYEHKKMGRIELGIVPFENGVVSPASVEAAIRPDTRFMVMTHGSNVLGSVQNIKAIGDLLHDRGIYFIVDGAQTAGHIPIDLSRLPVDAFVFTGHKGLFGIPGTGGCYLRDPTEILPVMFGGTGTNSSSLFHPLEMPERFEPGTQNHPGLAALTAGVRFIKEKGISSIAKKAEQQAAYIISELKKEENIILYHERPEIPIIAFNIRGLANDDVGFILARAYNIICRTGLHCAPLVHKTIDGGEGCVRLSLSCLTTDEECRVAAAAIREVARNAHPAVDSA